MTRTGREVWRMRAALPESPRAPAWPAGIRPATLAEADLPAVHALLVHAYARGGGQVSRSCAAWRDRLTGDDEYDPALCPLAWDGARLSGACLCWSSAFVKDLVVHERWRRRGLGEALLREALVRLAARSAQTVELKVESDNPAGAARLYARLGFRVVERLPG